MTDIVLSIVGRSGTGKTTLLEKLVRELTGRGYKVGTIKHDVHGFDIDREGKDSWRHKNAGAAMTIISSPTKIALIKDVTFDAEIDQIVAKYVDDVDIVLTEGYKQSKKPKIEVFRKAAYDDLLCSGEDNIVAIATDSIHDLNVPQFNINDAQGLTDLIEDKFLRKRVPVRVSLEVNGNPVHINPFLHSMLMNSVTGMIRALKGCSNPRSITIKIEKGEGIS
jgi:molybdopterin-guanine dinucleotide biosynthesis adapter protein